MSWAFIHTMRANPRQSYVQVHAPWIITFSGYLLLTVSTIGSPKHKDYAEEQVLANPSALCRWKVRFGPASVYLRNAHSQIFLQSIQSITVFLKHAGKFVPPTSPHLPRAQPFTSELYPVATEWRFPAGPCQDAYLLRSLYSLSICGG